MKAMCLNDNWPNPIMEGPKAGEIVTIEGASEVYQDELYISEYLIHSSGRKQSFHKKYFAPLSSIDEMELVNERELQTT